MNSWSVEKIQEFFTHLNEHFGLFVNPELKVGEKNKFPLQWCKGKILFIPDFFNNDELEEGVRTNLLLIMYSASYETLTVNDKDFVLTHSGLGSFQKDKNFLIIQMLICYGIDQS